MDFGRAVSFVRQDPNWIVKVLLGSVLSVIPILNFVTLGYMLDVIRNVSQGRETPLPDWGEDFGGKFVRGFLYLVIVFIYTLPVAVIYAVFIGITLAAASAGSNSDAASAAGAGVGILGCILVPIILIGAIVLGMLGQIAGARYALSYDFGAAMRFGEVWSEFRNNIGTWGMLILYSIIVQVVVALVAGITCGIGFLVSFYGTIVLGHLVAQAHRQSSGGYVTEPARY